MDFNKQKQAWHDLETPETVRWGRENLNRNWAHPDLRSLQRQLIFESLCWTLFLALYYTALDGHLRPTGWNIALIVALLLLIGHGILGYRLAARPIGDAPVLLALSRQLTMLKKYSWLSMLLRTLTLLIVFGFLISNVPDLLATPRLWLVGNIVIFIGVSFFIQYIIWRRRLRRLALTLQELGGE